MFVEYSFPNVTLDKVFIECKMSSTKNVSPVVKHHRY
jgi:hypothetical protein